ncbi:MAG: translation elongation factor Ts [Limisphaerales bacterium]|jgi:elongation factor Ts|nr:translation elongation factor Ts [Verrucomicrobiota bacterium]HBF02294.1 translation elongation factor Ts [Verrucomicrobiales bacterium]HCB97965.1 translation elongation factor Ts [Verrucomicrobiales bacterium]|tara:strand:- start:18 stop:848 length:831 start_codon:yes stop_codon:yes gene_type:complete
MAEITAALVGQLRRMTNAGLMDCKKALTENGGDLDAAVDFLRKKGIATAAKKAGRTANEGVIAHYIRPDGKLGLLVEVNCETDFVAKNDTFGEFCNQVAKTLVEEPNADFEAMRTAQITKVGENIQIGRKETLEVEGSGLVAAYIHTGAKVGVLAEVGATKDDTVHHESFKSLVKDITLQIAAANPSAVSREQVDPALVAKEKEIAAEQFKDKPAQAVEKIVEGKMEKFYQGICLVDQGFVKNGELTVKEHLAAVGKEIGDELSIRRFLRFQVGEG